MSYGVGLGFNIAFERLEKLGSKPTTLGLQGGSGLSLNKLGQLSGKHVRAMYTPLNPTFEQ